MTKELFKFPIILIDGSVEDRKIKDSEMLGLTLENEDPDIIYAEAECPYYDFLSVSDRWLPTDSSFENAKKGIFDACNVLFMNSGAFIVPMSKEEFRESLENFIENYHLQEEEELSTKRKRSKNKSEVKILKLSEKDVLDMLKKKLEEKDGQSDSE